VTDGDNGGRSGENGNCLASGGIISSGSNGGGYNSAGGSGYITISYWS
jgi:hypothetical protein